MRWFLILMIPFLASCGALIPVAEESAEVVAKEVVEEGLEDAIKAIVEKEMMKAFIGCSCLVAIAGYGWLFLRKKVNKEVEGGSLYQARAKGCEVPQVVKGESGPQSPA